MPDELNNSHKTSQLSDKPRVESASLIAGLPERLALEITSVFESDNFEYDQVRYTTFLKKFIPAFKQFETGQDSAIITCFKEALDNPEYDFGRFALPFIRAVIESSRRRKISFSVDLNKAILNLQASMFSELFDSEVRTLFAESLSFFLTKLDLVHELKRRFVLDDGMGTDDWGRDFLQSIESNEEVIGSQSILVDGQALPPFIKNWIKDYLGAVSSTAGMRGSLTEAQYFSKSQNVSKLTIEDKKTLQEVLQLYDWLLAPSGSMEELEAYEAAASNGLSEAVVPPQAIMPQAAPPPKVAPLQPPPVQARPKPVAAPQVASRNTAAPPPLPPRPPKPQPLNKPAPQPLFNPISIQDVLLDRKRMAQQIRPAQAPQKPAPVSTPKVEPPATPIPPAPSAASTPAQPSPDVEAKLAALRQKMQNNKH